MEFSNGQIQKFLEIAREESLKSSCFRACVGAVIVDQEKNILSTGYNAPPPGLPGSREIGFCNKERHGFKSGEGYHVCRSIHAEQRAILELGIHHTAGQTMFVFGHTFICQQCRQFILLAGILNVFLQPSSQAPYQFHDTAKWREEILSTIPHVQASL